jgi:hypothetical protein
MTMLMIEARLEPREACDRLFAMSRLNDDLECIGCRQTQEKSCVGGWEPHYIGAVPYRRLWKSAKMRIACNAIS